MNFLLKIGLVVYGLLCMLFILLLILVIIRSRKANKLENFEKREN
jgi:tellurite resistance protein TehA-like permease